jgi:hypothetical protein
MFCCEVFHAACHVMAGTRKTGQCNAIKFPATSLISLVLIQDEDGHPLHVIVHMCPIQRLNVNVNNAHSIGVVPHDHRHATDMAFPDSVEEEYNEEMVNKMNSNKNNSNVVPNMTNSIICHIFTR